MIIKIYGERNTGTNYLMKLLEKHVDIIEKTGSAFKIASAAPAIDLRRFGELGWKHRLVNADFFQKRNIDRESILVVALVKNPYSWLLSLHQCAYSPIHFRTKVVRRKANGKVYRRLFRECLTRLLGVFSQRISLFLSRYPSWCWYENLSFSDFIRAPWFSECHEGHDDDFENAIQVWNEKTKAYLALAKHYNVILLTYEELLAAPDVAFRKITDHLKIPIEAFHNIDKPAKKKDRRGSKDGQYYRDYYLNERWRKKLNAEDIQWISSQLDPKLMQALGYDYL